MNVICTRQSSLDRWVCRYLPRTNNFLLTLKGALNLQYIHVTMLGGI